MSILAAAIIDGDGLVSVSRVYIPGALNSQASHWNTLHRYLKDSSLGLENRASGSLEIEDLICLYRKLAHGHYLAMLCKRYGNIAEAGDTLSVLVDLLDELGPLTNNNALFDALFTLDETIQFGFTERPLSVALIRERLAMHSAAEDAAIEERKAKEAEAERIRRKTEAEFAAQRKVESGVTGALGLLNKAKGWLGFGEAKPEKKWGHGIPEVELERLRQKSTKGAIPASSKSEEDDSSDSDSSSSDTNWTSAKTKPTAQSSDTHSDSNDSPQPVKRPLGRGITLTKGK